MFEETEAAQNHINPDSLNPHAPTNPNEYKSEFKSMAPKSPDYHDSPEYRCSSRSPVLPCGLCLQEEPAPAGRGEGGDTEEPPGEAGHVGACRGGQQGRPQPCGGGGE